MLHFRYYCLTAQNRIVLGDHLAAPDLDAAIQAAYAACRTHPHFPSSRIEVWQGTELLYASGHDPAPVIYA